LSEKKILNETENLIPPTPLQVKWSVPKVTNINLSFFISKHLESNENMAVNDQSDIITKVMRVVCMYIILHPKGIIDQQIQTDEYVLYNVYMILCVYIYNC
jgi:hypothetical protein